MTETVETTYYTLHRDQYEEYKKLAEESEVSIDHFLLEFCEPKNQNESN